MARRKRVLIYVLVFMWLTAFSVLIIPPAEGTNQPTKSKSNQRCVSRDPAKNRQCLKNAMPKASPMRLASVNQASQLFYYNRTAKGRLNSISENKTTKWKLTTTASSTTFTTTSGSSAPTTATLNGATLVEVYRTDHWIWYSDSAIYSQNQQYIQPLLNWPETSYTQISQWLGLILPPGSYDGGRRAIFIDPSPGYFGWTSGGSIGIAYQVFQDVPDWPWVVIPHETTNMFTGEGVSGGWPTDWWADGRSPFPAMVAVQVEKTYNVPYWSIHDSDDSGDVQYVMMRDKLLGAYGWSLFSDTFAMMKASGINLANINPEFQDANWISLHYLKSHTIAYYLSRAAGVDLSSTLNQGSVGTPPPNWGGGFYNYQINLASVVPTAQIQSPTGTQRGTITLTATASDPDWGIADITVWYSLDNNIFYNVGTVQNGATSVTWDTTQEVPLSQSQVWVMAISHDYSGFESAWSVSNPFVVNNTPVSPAPTFDFSLSNSGDMAVTQGNSGLNTISVTMVNVQSQVVSLSCNTGLPSGAACVFNPSSAGSNFTSSLTVTTLSFTPPGSYPITVTGTSGSTSRQSPFTLTVNAPPLSFDFSISGSPTNQTVTQGQSASYSLMLNPISGAAQTVSLNLSGCPTDATCSINPQTGSPTFTSMLNVATASSTPPGRYSITLTALSGGLTHSTTLALTVTSLPPVFDFGISTSPANQTAIVGQSITYTISLSLVSGNTQPVSLSLSGCPAGVSCSFAQQSGNPTFATILTVATVTSTTPSTYSLLIAATSGTVTHSTTATLVVRAPTQPPFNFDLSNSGGITVTQGGSASNTISARLLGGTTQPVTLSCAVPSAISCSLNPASGTPGFQSILTIGTLPSTSTVTELVTVTGIAGGTTRTTQFNLTVVQYVVQYVVGYRPPTVSLSPISGPAGTFVTVTGSNFAAADTTCLISSLPGSLWSNSTCSASAGSVVGSFAVAPNAVSGTTYTVLFTGGTGDAASATFTVTVDPNTCTVSLTFDRPMVAPNRNASLTLTAQCLKGVGSYQVVVDIDNATQIANVGQAIGTGFMINPTLVSSGTEYRWLNLNANGQFSGTLRIPITIAASQTPLVTVQFTLDSRTAFKDAQGNSLSISPAPPLALNLYKVTAQRIFQALDAYFQNEQCSESSGACRLPLNRRPTVQDLFNLLDIYFN
jgi:hypothetical protein